MRKVSELAKLLSERYDGPTEEKQGYTYIPWYEAVTRALEVFGVTGWDEEIKQSWREEITGPENHTTRGYAAIVRVTIYTEDGRASFRDGLGFCELTFTTPYDYKNRDGELVHVPPIAQIDTAIKGAASNAILRALELFGNQFGLFIRAEAKAKNKANGNGGSRSSSSNGGNGSGGAKRGGPTDKQVEWLVKKGVVETEEQARNMTFDEAKAALDEVFNGGGSSKGNGKPAASRTTARNTSRAAAAKSLADEMADELDLGDDSDY